MQRGRLYTFDALRGLAAIAVLLNHANPLWMPSGYLAVDLFFVLSGFVIAKNYDGRFSRGMGLGEFSRLRIIRLYPLFLLGLLLGALRLAAQIVFQRPDRIPVDDFIVQLICGLLLLPSFVTSHISPINSPGWSLIFEVFINLVYAAALIQLRTKILIWIALFSGVALIAMAIPYGSIGMGWKWGLVPGGMARILYAFLAGVIIFRGNKVTPLVGYSFLLPIVLLCALLYFGIAGSGSVYYQLAVGMIAAPALVWMAAVLNPPAGFERLCEKLGDISYPLYAIHYPLLLLALHAQKANVPDAIWIPIFTVVMVVLSLVVDKVWDRPIRKALTRLFKPRDVTSQVLKA